MPNVITDRERIEAVLNRGVLVNILPTKEAFIERLMNGEPLRIYIGADPTSDALHLSHAKNYMLLEEFRQLGHEVIVLFGDFTARIGDPSDRPDARKQLSTEEISKNVEGWLRQITPLLKFDDPENPPRVLYNGEWLSKLSLADALPLFSNFTVQQMIERDMFQKRIRESNPIHLHEFFYPVMQGYDSVAMDVEAELCGTDQTFNALAGRTLIKRLKNKEKFVAVVNLMENPKTGELMSKSRGTGVFLSSPPEEMYGAIMAQPDEMIEVLFVNCTRIPLSEKDQILSAGPRSAKARVALEIVAKFYGEEAARAAENHFNAVFSKGEITPEGLPALVVSAGTTLLELVVISGVPESKSEARRLIDQGAVSIDGEVKKDPNEALRLGPGAVLKVGKRHFFRLES